MKCLKCNSTETDVIDSRASVGNITRRRRKCIHCDHRFTTYEVYDIDVVTPKVMKKLKTVKNQLRKIVNSL